MSEESTQARSQEGPTGVVVVVATFEERDVGTDKVQLAAECDKETVAVVRDVDQPASERLGAPVQTRHVLFVDGRLLRAGLDGHVEVVVFLRRCFSGRTRIRLACSDRPRQVVGINLHVVSMGSTMRDC